jgi:hypothetical protein
LSALVGFGFAIAGATPVFKQFQSPANLVQNALLFLKGTILPVESMPAWLASASRTLPSAQGITALRRVILHSRPLASVWQMAASCG